MGDTPFDQLARALGQRSRRAVVLGAIAGALGLASRAPQETDARFRNRPHRRKVWRRQQRHKRWRRRLYGHEQPAPVTPGCTTDGECAPGAVCQGGACEACASGLTGCAGACLDLSVCPANQQHVACNNSPGCICTRQAQDGVRFCAVSTTCNTPCGQNNTCPTGQACVVTCCDGPGHPGYRCLPSCG